MSQDKANNEAASASQSSTPVPRVGGNTSIDTPEFRERFKYMMRHEYAELVAYIDNFLAHVARQRQESAAVAEGVDTVILQRLVNEYRHACEMVQGHAIPQWRNIVGFVEHAVAQQREAGRLERDQDFGLLKLALEQAQERLVQAGAAVEAYQQREYERLESARQPVSEGLTFTAAADFIDAKAQKYLNENADNEPDTGAVVFHFGAAGREYHSALVELAEELRAAVPPATQPVQMILYCPACGLQHIDAPDERTEGWSNPPHRSHLCHGCGHVFRPADVPTEGVAAIQTRGSNDSAAPPAKAEGMSVEQIDAATEAIFKESGYTISPERARAILAQQAKGEQQP